MKKFFSTVAAVVVGGCILFLLPVVVMLFLGVASIFSSVEPVEAKSVLVYNMEDAIVDRSIEDPSAYMNALMGEEMSENLDLEAFKECIEAAIEDDNISALMLTGSANLTPMEIMKEMKPYLEKFAATEKPIYYHSSAISQSSMYFGSLADGVYTMPEGIVEFSGLASVGLYFKDAQELLGVEMQVLRHGKYKSAVEPYIANEMSEASREQTERMLDVLWEEIGSTIAKNRGVERKVVEDYTNNIAAMRADQALEAGLVDSLIYYDEYLAVVREGIGLEKDEDIPVVSLADYHMSLTPEVSKHSDELAVIYAEGEIYGGSSDSDPMNIYGDDLARTIREARLDDDVKAIVLRVNSPGGAVDGAETVWREVKLASETKPTVVSMGTYAASGGYYISAPANYIFAETNTLTGSIGVFGVLPTVEKAAEKLGVNADGAFTHKSAITIWNKMDDEQRESIQQSIEDTYATFLKRCSDGRGLSVESVDSIGQGRVWAGADALKIGLVDEIGSLDDAIAYAAEKAGLTEYSKVNLPEIEDSYTLMMKQLGLSVRSSIVREVLGVELEDVKLPQMRGIVAYEPVRVKY